MRVLVVENDCWVRDLLCELLSDFNIEATGVADSQEAVRLLSTVYWDMILSDLLFPGRITGLDLAAQAAERGVRCIIMSGAVDRGPEIEARGIQFLAKPFGIAELSAAVGDKVPCRLVA